MHPAFSVIFLTTLIGAGQGLFLALFTVESYGLLELVPSQGPEFYAHGSLLALALLVLGLFASFFHLGRPERAWRTATKWRTSWLSREVIVLPAFMAVVFLYGLAHWTGFNPSLGTLPGGYNVLATVLLGALGALLAFALFLSTAMIYAAVKFLQEWHSPLTVVNYTLLGGASGFTLAAAYAAWAQTDLVSFLAGWAIILTLLALVSRAASLIRNARIKPISSLQTAIGVKHPRIEQKSQGFMGGSFNTREFFHHRSAGFVRAVKWAFLIGVFAIPAALLALAMLMTVDATPVLVAAFAVQYLGLLAERWFFFAQANHPQNLYYQSVA
ncbi:Anaerobic dimethyl sulfoxide reductase chain C [Thioalkalivibrio nitratireducens DSM 14787]|uniref:Anaerobic dimethyl sulfoxide reductase chain C n=1 Tax=Thioalkalivibrio nitratireducens (strain DSM 14787 / UNIQEM 213 / ALEN2) TaxID=1255043 RepID=L0E214_THIND|nr:DmsC/YnfH family molybdoenzyme membrane anchor subunit [Thioalkalivibrio nitratireducens]AGA35250.1 Anaerobic dimethyl sulfoxide reductase chain C [Thioalkalivibrio nitratireducens DSM 14787]